MIKVVVTGYLGRMGREVCRAVAADEELKLVGVAEPRPDNDIAFTNTLKETGVRVGANIREVLDGVEADVLVDFTRAAAVLENALAAVDAGVHTVIGTTGLSDGDIAALKKAASTGKANILLAPNFAVGAVLMMKFAQQAAPLAARAEIIELHHDKKTDAPSGTAKLTAELMGAEMTAGPLEERENIAGVRGGRLNGITIHSVRLPGLVAHQEVILGFPGQTLTIRHDSITRSSFMPGVITAVKNINRFPGFTYGLDKILGL